MNTSSAAILSLGLVISAYLISSSITKLADSNLQTPKALSIGATLKMEPLSFADKPLTIRQAP